MISNTELIQQIAETITETIRKALNTEGEYDRTYTASVIEKIGRNKYTVEYNGGQHTAQSTITLSVGDVVRVCLPRNDESELFVVMKVS